MLELPTIAQCLKFMDKINEGREIVDLPALDALEYDSCIPGDPWQCLSATNLFGPAGYSVCTTELCFSSRSGRPTNTRLVEEWGREIPVEILDVTEVFDVSETYDMGNELRDRLVEAGVVEP